MIKSINNKNQAIAKKILQISIDAYSVEAELINYKNLPPLSENVGDIESSESSYIGYHTSEGLAGVIELSSSEEGVWINRLVVSPREFRQGIASKLLNHVLINPGVFRVGTAKDNIPAISLYKKVGFKFESTKEVGSPLITWVTYKYTSM